MNRFLLLGREAVLVEQIGGVVGEIGPAPFFVGIPAGDSLAILAKVEKLLQR